MSLAALLVLLALGQTSALAPVPDLTRVEPAVREQLEQLYRAAEAAEGETRAPRLATLGAALLAHQFNEAAIATLEQALVMRPDWTDGHHYLGYALSEIGRYAEARRHFERELELEPDRVVALYSLGRVEWELGELDRALAHLEQGLELAPEAAAIHETLGQIELDRQNTKRAIEHLERALELAPEANRVHYTLSRAYRAAGDMEAARSHLEQRGSVGITIEDPALERLEALRLGATGRQLRGRQAYAAGRFRDAVVEFEAALEADPSRNDVRFNLAAALGEAGEVDRAIEQLEAALTIEPDRPRALSNLAMLHLRKGDLAPAIAALEKAVTLDPQDTVTRSLLARTLVEADPGNEQLRLDESDLLLEMGRFGEALERLDRAHEALPASGLIAHALARQLATTPVLELRDGERATTLAQAVVRAAPTFDHRQTLVFALAEAGRCEEAAELQRQNLEMLRQQADPALLERQGALLQHLVAQRPCRLEFEN